MAGFIPVLVTEGVLALWLVFMFVLMSVVKLVFLGSVFVMHCRCEVLVEWCLYDRKYSAELEK
jgi:hypothetical protein